MIASRLVIGNKTRPAAIDVILPHRICINLTRRADRWARVRREFEAHGLQVSRSTARDGADLDIPAHWTFSAGAYGCALSHLEAVREARDSGRGSLLVFEDDVELHPNFGVRFEEFAKQLPSDWRAIFLGGIHRQDPISIGQNIARVSKSNSTFAYALNQTVFNHFIRANEPLTIPVDETNKVLQQQFAFYCPTPPLAWVVNDYSDILEAEVNHWWVREGLALEGNLSREIISKTGVVILPYSDECSYSRPVSDFVFHQFCLVFPNVLRICDAACEPGHLIPANGRYWGTGIRDRSALLTQAAAQFDANCEYLVIAEPNAYVPGWELKASVMKCCDHDVVAALHAPLELTPEDTAKVVGRSDRAVDTTPYARREPESVLAGLCIVQRACIPKLAPHLDTRLQDLTVFRSPSRIWRLSAL